MLFFSMELPAFIVFILAVHLGHKMTVLPKLEVLWRPHLWIKDEVCRKAKNMLTRL